MSLPIHNTQFHLCDACVVRIILIYPLKFVLILIVVLRIFLIMLLSAYKISVQAIIHCAEWSANSRVNIQLLSNIKLGLNLSKSCLLQLEAKVTFVYFPCLWYFCFFVFERILLWIFNEFKYPSPNMMLWFIRRCLRYWADNFSFQLWFSK